ncbi:MAG: hypothetical protein AB7I38_15165 [Dehalococcoidia bacterium]
MRLYVHREGKQDPEAVEADEGATLAGVLGSEASVVLLLEDEDEVLDPALTLGAAGVKDRAHLFVGQRKRVEVVVMFNGKQIERTFSASAPVKRVLRWAVGKRGFDLEEADAAEHELRLSESGKVPAPDAHLGSLDDATPGRLSFALARKVAYQG